MSALLARIAETDTVTVHVPADEADEARRLLGEVAIEVSTTEEPIVDPPGRCTVRAQLDGDDRWRISPALEDVPPGLWGPWSEASWAARGIRSRTREGARRAPGHRDGTT